MAVTIAFAKAGTVGLTCGSTFGLTFEDDVVAVAGGGRDFCRLSLALSLLVLLVLVASMGLPSLLFAVASMG